MDHLKDVGQYVGPLDQMRVRFDYGPGQTRVRYLPVMVNIWMCDHEKVEWTNGCEIATHYVILGLPVPVTSQARFSDQKCQN